MTCNPKIHHRRSIRLKGYDYSGRGFFFITLCTQNRLHLFGDIENGQMILNEAGRLTVEALQWMPMNYDYLQIDGWVVMPNHLHAIFVIHDRPDSSKKSGSRTSHTQTGQTATRFEKPKPLGRLIGVFKTVSTKRINESRQSPGVPVWQRNYHEHIIRDDQSYNHISEYMKTNPQNWHEDLYYCENSMNGKVK